MGIRPRLTDLALPLAGAAVTILAAYVAASRGATIGIAVLAVLLVYVGTVVAFLAVPHRAVAATIALFAVLPALKVFVSPSIGGIKDVVAFGAISAGIILVGFEKRRLDRWIGLLAGIFIFLYVVNIGHPHGAEWVTGLRLTGEPILLLLVGCVLPDPRRNLRWALGAFAGVGVLVALYGLLQQGLGISHLEALGYVYGMQIRQIGPSLRSFGTMDDPFAYAAFLYFAVAAAFWVIPKGWLRWVVETILLLGLLVSFVRTAGLVLLGFLALIAFSRRLTFPALALLAAVAVLGGLTLSHSSGIQTQSYEVYFANGGSALISRPVNDPGGVLLNGRVSAWTAAVGSRPLDWIFGRGVGDVGTAAQRASVGVLSTTMNSATADTQATAVDSGYLATVADVGIVGLIVELALFGRIMFLGIQQIRAGRTNGWMPLSFLLALLLDALTRASFTGFPTAFVGLMLVGIAVASLQEADGSRAGVAQQPGPARRRGSAVSGAISA